MIKPLDDRVLVKIEKSDEKNEMGLIIPATAKDKEQEGIVVAVGPGKLVDGKHVPLQVKEGDKVFFGKTIGTEVKFAGESYYLFPVSQIQAVIED